MEQSISRMGASPRALAHGFIQRFAEPDGSRRSANKREVTDFDLAVVRLRVTARGMYTAFGEKA